MDCKEIPFYKVSDMNSPGNETFLFGANNYIDEQVVRKLRAKVFPKGTIVFAKVGAALLLNRKRITSQPCLIDNNMMGIILPNDSLIDGVFLYYEFLNFNIPSLSRVGALPSVNASDIEKIEIHFPEIAEQREISHFLSLIDQRIAVQNKIIEELETFEKTFWNCLLNEEGCLLESIGNMFFVSKEKLGSGPQIPVYTASAKEGLIDEERYFKKKVSGNDKSNYQIVRKGDYVFSKSSSRDAPFGVFIRFKDEIGIVSPLYWVLRPKREIDQNLIRIWFSSSFAAKQFKSKCQEGARNHGMLNISLSDFLAIKMWKSLPQSILECKRLINAKLEKAKEQAKLFQQEKSFLLKAMFI